MNALIIPAVTVSVSLLWAATVWYCIILRNRISAKEQKEVTSKARREERQEKKAQNTQQNIAGRITGFLEAAAKLNPTHLVNPQAKIVVHNIGCINCSPTHEIFVGWQNQYHTLGIVQVLIDKHSKVWSESVSKEAVFNTSAFPSDEDIDRFARNVAEFVCNFNRPQRVVD